jgi:hypothetical protein
LERRNSRRIVRFVFVQKAAGRPPRRISLFVERALRLVRKDGGSSASSSRPASRPISAPPNSSVVSAPAAGSRPLILAYMAAPAAGAADAKVAG